MMLFCVHEANSILINVFKNNCISCTETGRNVSHVTTYQFAIFKEWPCLSSKSVNLATLFIQMHDIG
jgi:hypothetical protein